MLKKWMILIACLNLACFALAQSSTMDEQKTAALSAGKKWLALVDSGEYKQAYDQMAPFVKQYSSFNHFEEGALITRRSFGAVQSRQETSTEFQALWPNAPAGQYVVIWFETSFLGRDGAVETFAKEQVVMKLSSKNEWQPASYTIN